MNKSRFVLLIALVSVQAAFGWDLVINNMTRYKAVLEIIYASPLLCPNNDYPVIMPGRIVTVDAGGCFVKSIRGVLVPVTGDPSKNISLIGWGPRGRRDISAAIVDRGDGKYEIQVTEF